MRNLYSNFLIFTAILCFTVQNSKACGYDWVGECSSTVHLRINGTLDSFDIADCPSGIRFNGLHLGTLQNLSLANAKTITWESCFNNVSAVGLKYRVYEQGGGAGNFQNLNLDQDYFTVLGPYTTRYRSKASNINLATGLTIGKTYILEVYFVADVDTIGDDFIPETTLSKNNNGQNYKLTFTYGGPTAPPFVLIPTNVKEPNCHGESNGSIGVSVWGDHTGLFYNWSNVNLNFFQQNGLPAGTYTVTATGANYAESTTVVLDQPEVLTLQTANIQPVNCGGGQGSITVNAGGGTPPYHYLWSNAQTTATGTFLNGGTYALTLTDAHNCLLVQTYNLPSGGAFQQSSATKICTGETIEIAGVVINAGGVYNLVVPGNAGCDTLLTLTVDEINPGALLSSLPSNILVSCNVPSVNLCAAASPDAVFQWSKDGIPATQTPCLLATAGGVYSVTANVDGCLATKNIVSEEHLVSPIFTTSGVGTYIMDCYTVDSTILHLYAHSNAVGAQWEWTFQGQVISSTDSCLIPMEGIPSQLPAPTVTLTDQYGCYNTKAASFVLTSPPMPPYPDYYFESNLCLGMIKVESYILGSGGPYTTSFNDSIIVGNEFYLLPGHYNVEITDIQGCKTNYEMQVPELFYASVSDSPFPDWNTGSISIYELSGAWYSYTWDNGEIGSDLYSLAPGTYCVTITDQQNGCAIDTCFVVHGSVATQELPANNVQCSPNPARPGDAIEIKLPELFWGDEIVLEFMDAQGKKYPLGKVGNSSANQRIQLPAALSPGVFYLRVISVKSEAIGKLSLIK